MTYLFRRIAAIVIALVAGFYPVETLPECTISVNKQECKGESEPLKDYVRVRFEVLMAVTEGC
jgi:hypothetical protein